MSKEKYDRSDYTTEIPNSLIDDSTLTQAEKLILIGIYSYALGSKTTCNPSLTTLGRIACVGWRQANRLVNNIELKGYVHIERKAGDTHTYHLSMPLPTSSASGVTHVMDVIGGPMSPVAHEYKNKSKKRTNKPKSAKPRGFLAQFNAAYRTYKNCGYHYERMDRRIATELGKIFPRETHPYELIDECLDLFFHDPVIYLYTLPRFNEHIDRYIRQVRTQHDLKVVAITSKRKTPKR